MNKNIFSVSAVLISLGISFLTTGCGSSASVNGAGQSLSGASGIIGTWAYPGTIDLGNGLTFTMKIKFDSNQVTNFANCNYNGTAQSAQVSAAVTIDSSSFTVASPASNTVGSCSANIAAGTIKYSVSGNSLTLTSSDGSAPVILTRQ